MLQKGFLLNFASRTINKIATENCIFKLCWTVRVILRRIFGLKRDEVTGGWRKLHNEELHNLYSSLSIIRMIKSRRMRWARHVARMGERRNA
jgi:hypothetical protein